MKWEWYEYTCACRLSEWRKVLASDDFYLCFDIKRHVRRLRLRIGYIWIRVRQQTTRRANVARYLALLCLTINRPRLTWHLGGPRCAARDFPGGWHASVDVFSFRRWSPVRKKNAMPLTATRLIRTRPYGGRVARFVCQFRLNWQIAPARYICVEDIFREAKIRSWADAPIAREISFLVCPTEYSVRN